MLLFVFIFLGYQAGTAIGLLVPGFVASQDVALNLQPLNQPPRNQVASRLARVVGVEADDPLLEEVDRTLQSSPVSPDNRDQWTNVIRPICASAPMRLRYHEFPSKLGEFIKQAYGRNLTAADEQAVHQAFSGLDLSQEAMFHAVCMGVLTSPEFLVGR